MVPSYDGIISANFQEWSGETCLNLMNFLSTGVLLARSVIVGGAAEKYARARSGDTTFFIYLLFTNGAQKTGRRNLNKNISVARNMVKNSINMSEEGDVDRTSEMHR